MNKLMIKLIKLYQRNKSFIGVGRCKYIPSCSNYGLECYENFNFFKASFLTMYRIIRCNPLSKGGYDPIPRVKIKKKKH